MLISLQGYWKCFLQWRVFVNLQKSKYVPSVVPSAWHVLLGPRVHGSFSPMIFPRLHHITMYRLPSLTSLSGPSCLNSLELCFDLYRDATTPLVPKWNFYASSPNPAPLPVPNVSAGATLWKSCSLAPPLFSMALEKKPKALNMLGKHSSTELHLQTLSGHFHPIPIDSTF